jgi:hypothetical protein
VNGKSKNCKVCDILSNPPLFNIMFGAGAVGAGAALRFGSGFTKMMRLFVAPAQQHCLKQQHFKLFSKSWGFYSLRSDPDLVFSEFGSGSGQNGPDPQTLALALTFLAKKYDFSRKYECHAFVITNLCIITILRNYAQLSIIT